MYTHESQIRVRYGETDQMGYCYYGNYAQYYEVGRVEALRDLGFAYKSLEEDGIMLPVLDFQIKYLKPAHYDDLLTIRTIIRKEPHLKGFKKQLWLIYKNRDAVVIIVWLGLVANMIHT